MSKQIKGKLTVQKLRNFLNGKVLGSIRFGRNYAISKLPKNTLVNIYNSYIQKNIQKLNALKPNPIKKIVKINNPLIYSQFISKDFYDKGDADIYCLPRILIDKKIYGKIRVLLLVKQNDEKIVYQALKYGAIKEQNMERISVDYRYNVPNKGIYSWFDSKGKHNNYIKYDWFGYPSEKSVIQNACEYYDEVDEVYRYDWTKKVTLVIMKPTELSENAIAQKFAEGVNHCLLSPIIDLCSEKILTLKTKKASEKYITLKNKCLSKIEDYKTGVPEDKLQEVSDYLGVNFNIRDIFNKQFLSIRSKAKYIFTTFDYINSKFNHVDFSNNINAQVEKELSKEEANEKFNLLMNTTSDAITYSGSPNDISSFTHKGIIYTTPESDYNIAEKRFLDESYLGKLRINTIKSPELYEFVSHANHICSCVDYKDNIVGKEFDNLKQIDMIKAYTQFKNAGKYYVGFPSTLFAMANIPEDLKFDGYKLFLEKHIGIFKITDITFDNIKNENIKNHLMKLNIYCNKTIIKRVDSPDDLDYGIDNLQSHNEIIENTNTIILPSCEISYLIDLGVEFKLIGGAYASVTKHFEFPNEFLNKKDNGVPYYAKFCGKYMTSKETITLQARVDKSLANTIYSTYKKEKDIECDIEYYEFKNLLSISFQKNNAYSLTHITAFIMSYMRINLYNQLFKMDYDKVLRVNMDGIYYQDHDFEINELFRYKDSNSIPNNSAAMSFITNSDFNKEMVEYIPVDRIQYHRGPGGGGKTDANLRNTGYQNMYYSAPSKKLVSVKKKDYGVNGIVFARLLERQCINNFVIDPSVIILDEGTMYTDEDLTETCEKFPHTTIIIIGDINKDGLPYQLPPINGPMMKLDKVTYFKEFNTIRRTNDERLKQILIYLRKMIDDNKNVNDAIDYLIENINLRCITKEYVKDLYNIDDYIITSKKVYVEYWTKKFTGKFDKEKYFVTKNTFASNNGEIIISNEPVKNSIIRHAFTIHSIQGETCNTKLFIDLRNIFGGIQMLYTAISRATTCDNIYLIKTAADPRTVSKTRNNKMKKQKNAKKIAADPRSVYPSLIKFDKVKN